jgi:transaldolase
VSEAAQLGADISTLPFSIIDKFIKLPLTELGLEKFLADWNKLQIAN